MPKSEASPLFTFRFGLIGGRRAGKTTLLASLSMARSGSPPGVTLQTIPDAKVTTIPHRARQSDGGMPDFERGRMLLEEVRGALLSGEPHKATDDEFLGYMLQATTTSTNNITFVASSHEEPGMPHITTIMRSMDVGKFSIEIADYSGEMLRRESSHAERARLLRRRLRGLDGLIVLAEAPSPEEGTEEQTARLFDLGQVIAQLSSEAATRPIESIPVALVINKWDRISNPSGSTPQAEAEALLDFFQSGRGADHHRLLQLIEGLVGPGRVAAFPVSALGPCTVVRTADGYVYEVPATKQPLRSFGLEAPFLYLAAGADDANISAMAATWRSANPLNIADIGGYRNVRPTPRAMLLRFGQLNKGHAPEYAAQAKAVRAGMQRLALIQCCALALAVGMLPPVGVLLHDSLQASKFNPNLAALATTDKERLEDLRRWLATIADDSGYLRRLTWTFVIDRAAAQSKLQEVSGQLAYLDGSQALQALKVELADLRARTEGLSPSFLSSEVIVLLDQANALRGHSLPQPVNPQLQAQWDEITAAISPIEADLRAKRVLAERREFRQKVAQMLTVPKTTQLAPVVLGATRLGLKEGTAINEASWAITEILRRLRLNAAEARTAAEWRRVGEAADAIRLSADIAAELRKLDTKLLSELDDIASTAWRQEDRTLYASVTQYRTPALEQEIARGAPSLAALLGRYGERPDRRMSNEVAKLSDYIKSALEQRRVVFQLEYAAFGSYGNATYYSQTNNQSIVTASRQPFSLQCTNLSDGATHILQLNTAVNSTSSGLFRPPRDDKVSFVIRTPWYKETVVRCSLTCPDCSNGWTGYYKVDFGNKDFTLSLPQKPTEAPFRMFGTGEYGGAADLKFSLQYESLPEPPPLPIWRE